ncbi:MAG: hypothetical protein Q8O92_14140, partial [Candidatus Latescibacter sp.]|nr:hypothetical protein [Candidatus Latescibacter sp.]
MKTKSKQDLSVVFTLMVSTVLFTASALAAGMEFPDGTATPSEMCGACHKAIYKEFALGFGGDSQYKYIFLKSAK